MLSSFAEMSLPYRHHLSRISTPVVGIEFFLGVRLANRFRDMVAAQ
jgi:hypothetical protein